MPKIGKSFLPLHQNLSKMVTELLVVWIVGVVAFFVLWAILLKVIKRISERKNKKEDFDSTVQPSSDQSNETVENNP